MLLNIPPEIRNQIYRHYLTTAHGYFFNYESGKLTAHNHEPIDMALQYTCSLVASEMQGMALGLNQVTFSTVYSTDISARLGLFEDLFHKLHNLELRHLLTAGQSCLDSADFEEAFAKFPQFASVLDNLRDEGRVDHNGNLPNCGLETWGESIYAARHFITALLELMSKHDHFDHLISEHLGTSDIESILALPGFPWLVPNQQHLDDMIHALGKEPLRVTQLRRSRNPRSAEWKPRMSAALAAEQFLTLLPTNTRCQLRTILLHEDRASAAFPETHAQVLVKFCQENPNLRVERRVSLWKAVWTSRAFFEEGFDLRSGLITGPLASWMAETLALSAAGMPNGSFSLVFDGDQVPDLCSKMVQEVVHQDAAWQAAVEIRYSENPSLASHYRLRWHLCYFFTGFPEAMRDICAGTSSARFDFDPGVPTDVYSLMSKHPDWTDPLTWQRNWTRSDGFNNTWDPSPALPSFQNLLLENVDSP